MYKDEEVFARVAKARKQFGPFISLSEFKKEYEKKFIYPCYHTIRKRFGGWRRLLQRTMDWEMKQLTCGIMLAGTYKDTSGKVLLRIIPKKDYFIIATSIQGVGYQWKIPRREI